MLKNFRTYQSAIAFYRQTQSLHLKGDLKDQLSRASSSIVLNLAEGSAKLGKADKRRFYVMAMGSARECQAIFELLELQDSDACKVLDAVAAQLYRLTHPG